MKVKSKKSTKLKLYKNFANKLQYEAEKAQNRFINKHKRSRKNPQPPRFAKSINQTKSDVLKYISENYNLMIHDNENLKKILSNIKFINYIASGSQSDVFKFTVKERILLTDYNSKAMLFPDKIYALKLGYVSGECFNISKILSKYKIIPKIYFGNKNYIIMDYIIGTTLYDFSFFAPKYNLESVYLELLKQRRILIDQATKLFPKMKYDWETNDTNFIVSFENGKYKLHFIDPCI